MQISCCLHAHAQASTQLLWRRMAGPAWDSPIPRRRRIWASHFSPNVRISKLILNVDQNHNRRCCRHVYLLVPMRRRKRCRWSWPSSWRGKHSGSMSAASASSPCWSSASSCECTAHSSSEAYENFAVCQRRLCAGLPLRVSTRVERAWSLHRKWRSCRVRFRLNLQRQNLHTLCAVRTGTRQCARLCSTHSPATTWTPAAACTRPTSR